MNTAVLIGRLTKDPEIRATSGSDSVANFTLAVDRGYTSADGQSADFIRCVAWGRTAENLAAYCRKGSQIALQGSIRTRSYDNAQGYTVYVTEVQARQIEFLGKAQDDHDDEFDIGEEDIGF